MSLIATADQEHESWPTLHHSTIRVESEHKKRNKLLDFNFILVVFVSHPILEIGRLVSDEQFRRIYNIIVNCRLQP